MVNKSKERYEDYYKSAALFMSFSPGYKWIAGLLDELFEKIKPDSIKSILDVGCGEGVKTHFLKTRFDDAAVLGIDFSGSAIEAAKAFDNIPDLEFRLVEADDSSVWDREYDMISAFEILEHIDDWKSLLDTFVKHSSKYLLITVPTGRMRKFETHLGHLRNFKKNEIEDYLAERNFLPVDVFYAGFPFLSPISRDVMNLFFKFQQKNIENAARPSILTKIYSKTLYFLYEYCSTRHRFGDQFLGLFQKQS